MNRRENTRKFVTLSALIMQTYHCIHWRKKHASKGSSSPIVSLMLQPSTTLCFPTTQSVPLSTFFFPPFLFLLLISSTLFSLLFFSSSLPFISTSDRRVYIDKATSQGRLPWRGQCHVVGLQSSLTE